MLVYWKVSGYPQCSLMKVVNIHTKQQQKNVFNLKKNVDMIRNILCDDSNPTVALHGQYPDVVDYEPTKQFNDYYPYEYLK